MKYLVKFEQQDWDVAVELETNLEPFNGAVTDVIKQFVEIEKSKGALTYPISITAAPVDEQANVSIYTFYGEE